MLTSENKTTRFATRQQSKFLFERYSGCGQEHLDHQVDLGLEEPLRSSHLLHRPMRARSSPVSLIRPTWAMWHGPVGQLLCLDDCVASEAWDDLTACWAATLEEVEGTNFSVAVAIATPVPYC